MADWNALAFELQTDPASLGYLGPPPISDAAAAAILNAIPPGGPDSISTQDLMRVLDGVDWPTQAADRAYIQALLTAGDEIHMPAGSAAHEELKRIFGDTSTTWAAILGLLNYAIKRHEQIRWGGGDVTAAQVGKARARPVRLAAARAIR